MYKSCSGPTHKIKCPNWFFFTRLLWTHMSQLVDSASMLLPLNLTKAQTPLITSSTHSLRTKPLQQKPSLTKKERYFNTCKPNL